MREEQWNDSAGKNVCHQDWGYIMRSSTWKGTSYSFIQGIISPLHMHYGIKIYTLTLSSPPTYTEKRLVKILNEVTKILHQVIQ